MINFDPLHSDSDESTEEENLPMEPRRYRFMPLQHYVTDTDFRQCFRMPRRIAELLYQRIGHRLQPKMNTNHTIPPPHRLLCALRYFEYLTVLLFLNQSWRYYGEKTRYDTVGHSMGPSGESVMRFVKIVTTAILEEMADQIRLPNEEEARRTAVKFGKKTRNRPLRMPNVIGVIDGCLFCNILIIYWWKIEQYFSDKTSNWWWGGLLYKPSWERKTRHQRRGNLWCRKKVEITVYKTKINRKYSRFILFSARGTGRMHDERVCKLFAEPAFDGQPEYRAFPGCVVIGDSAYSGRDWLIPLSATNNWFMQIFYS